MVLRADLSTEYVGLTLRNPLLAAPAGITETVGRMKRAEDNGIGAVVVKTLFEPELTRRSPTPRFRVLRHALGPMRSFTLYSYEQASGFGPDDYGRELVRAKDALDIP